MKKSLKIMTEKIIKFGLLIQRIYAEKGKYKIFLLLKFNFKIYREKYYLSLFNLDKK